MVSTGDLKQNYEVLGIVAANVDDQNTVAGKGGCGGATTTSVTVDANTTYQKGADRLLELAKKKGGDAVVYATFDYRIAIKGAGNLAKQVKELFCYGTAVKLKP